MKVVSYYNVVPSKNKTPEKFDLLTKFIKGVNAVGDEGIVHTGYNLLPCDVGLIQGWQHERGKTAPHLKLRQDVIDCTQNRVVCTADANLFKFATPSNQPHHYLRYSFNDIFPNTGIYCDDNPDPSRWQQISKDCGIRLKDVKQDGNHILICAQRDKGWSMGKKSLDEWLWTTCNKLRQHTDRLILVRLHPGDKESQKRKTQIADKLKPIKDVRLSNIDRPIEEDLVRCWAVVNHNSSSIVGPLIHGYRAFVTDPTTSQCRDVADSDLSLIETPNDYNREKWLYRISMFHWKFTELENGNCWKHMRNYL